MPIGTQAQLLRVLEEGRVRRVGGERSIEVDVRFLAATNRDLEQAVAAGKFREDLLYRLQVIVIQLPPLRERPGDIPLLIDHFLRKIAREREVPAPPISAGLVATLEECRWPGNVRQLENTLGKLVVLSGGRKLSESLVETDPNLRKLLRPNEDTAPATAVTVRRPDAARIRAALKATGGNKSGAARMLGVSRATIYRWMKESGIS